MELLDRMDARVALTEEEAQVLDAVRALCRQKIAANAEHVDRSGEFPWDNVRAINEMGLNTMFIPEAFGGSQLSYACYLACVREISEACASTGIIWATNFHAIKPVIDFGNEEQKARFLPVMAAGGLAALAITEATAGSDATGMKTTFRSEGDYIRVDGTKSFITNGDVADLYVVFGKWADISDPKGAISVLVLEKGTPGFQVIRTEDKMGTRGSSTAALAFDGCMVPRANLISEPGLGLKVLFGSLEQVSPKRFSARPWHRKGGVQGLRCIHQRPSPVRPEDP